MPACDAHAAAVGAFERHCCGNPKKGSLFSDVDVVDAQEWHDRVCVYASRIPLSLACGGLRTCLAEYGVVV